MKRKICVVTGSRAEYGILRGLMKAIKDDSELQLQIIATNQHLSKLQGETYKEIERDGFIIDYKVYMADDEAPDNANSTAKAISRGVSGFADAFDVLQPSLLLILGDRYEMLAVASTALIYKIPIAHLHGGEITEGAFDDAIRHAITKMSHLHFTSTEAYRKRVIQLGEQPERVFNVGALGVENVMKNDFMSKEEIEQSLNFMITDKCFLCTYHPVTLSNMSSETQVMNLLQALDDYKDYHIIFTYSNSDTNSQIIIKRIQEYVDRNEGRCMFIPSLGQRRYFSALKYMTAVMGTEVIVFFLAGFEPQESMDAQELAEEVAENAAIAAQTNTSLSEETVAALASAATGMANAPIGGGTVIVGGGGVPAGGTIVINGGGGSSQAGEASPSAGEPIDAAQLAENISSAPVFRSAQFQSMAPEMQEATKAYVEQLTELTDTLKEVAEQSARLTRDSEEMENMNRTLTGINRFYEMQLKSVGTQSATIDEVNEQTRKLAGQLQELNEVYAKMVEALKMKIA